MMLGQDRDQLLERPIPKVARRKRLRACPWPPWWRCVIGAVVDVEALGFDVIDAELADARDRALPPRLSFGDAEGVRR
jgi:hypothetical protein